MQDYQDHLDFLVLKVLEVNLAHQDYRDLMGHPDFREELERTDSRDCQDFQVRYISIFCKISSLVKYRVLTKVLSITPLTSNRRQMS